MKINAGLFLFSAFVLIPVAEIAAFIAIGGAIGIGFTLLGILATALIGSVTVRQQGLVLIGEIRSEMDANRLPSRQLAHGAMVLAAGLLLLTPGFVTDSLGFLLLFPPARSVLYAWLMTRLQVHLGIVANGDHTSPPPRRPTARPERDVFDLDPTDYRDETPNS